MIKEISLHGRAPEAVQSQVHEVNRNKTSLNHDSHASGGSFGMCFWGEWCLGTSLPSVVSAPEKGELAHDSVWRTIARGEAGLARLRGIAVDTDVHESVLACCS